MAIRTLTPLVTAGFGLVDTAALAAREWVRGETTTLGLARVETAIAGPLRLADRAAGSPAALALRAG